METHVLLAVKLAPQKRLNVETGKPLAQQKTAWDSSLNIAFVAKAKSIRSRKAFWLTAQWLITVAQQLVNFTRFPSFRLAQRQVTLKYAARR